MGDLYAFLCLSNYKGYWFSSNEILFRRIAPNWVSTTFELQGNSHLSPKNEHNMVLVGVSITLLERRSFACGVI